MLKCFIYPPVSGPAARQCIRGPRDSGMTSATTIGRYVHRIWSQWTGALAAQVDLHTTVQMWSAIAVEILGRGLLLCILLLSILRKNLSVSLFGLLISLLPAVRCTVLPVVFVPARPDDLTRPTGLALASGR